MWNYSEKVQEYFFDPKNAGVLENPDGVGEVGSISCGDALRLMIKVDPQTNIITDAKFQTFGCGSAIASSSALTELVIGKTIDEARGITNQDIADFLGGLPPEKMHCSVMGHEALIAAIANYTGEELAEDDHEEGALLCKCFGIDEGMVERAVRGNKLTSLEQVTAYTKAGGSCKTCHEKIEEKLADINAAMVAEGLLTAAEAFTLGASKPAAAPQLIQISPLAAEAKKVQSASPAMTTLQKIKIIEQAITELRPHLQADGGDIELIDVEGDSVFVSLTGACAGCQMSAVTVQGVQAALMEKLGRPVRVIPNDARRLAGM